MILTVPFRLLYLIFDRPLSWLLLLGRTSSSKDVELVSEAPPSSGTRQAS
jgi:hypothetical protein